MESSNRFAGISMDSRGGDSSRIFGAMVLGSCDVAVVRIQICIICLLPQLLILFVLEQHTDQMTQIASYFQQAHDLYLAQPNHRHIHTFFPCSSTTFQLTKFGHRSPPPPSSTTRVPYSVKLSKIALYHSSLHQGNSPVFACRRCLHFGTAGWPHRIFHTFRN